MDKILTPQQEAFLSYYTNPKSETFSNALQSALKAGYSQEYSESITSKNLGWLTENVGDMKMLNKAEKVLNKTLEYEPVNEEGKIDTSLLAIQNKTAQFVAERLNKGKYSTKGDDAADKLADNIKTLIINKQYGNDNKTV